FPTLWTQGALEFFFSETKNGLRSDSWSIWTPK
ncbi:MAG: hypothetical protein ACI9UA_002006, partial [Pseudoalteromonas tetraodonis]